MMAPLDPTILPSDRPCQMCNDKQGLGAPPKPKPKPAACQRCLACRACSAAIPLSSKFSVQITDKELEGFKETFMMFDKVGNVAKLVVDTVLMMMMTIMMMMMMKKPIG